MWLYFYNIESWHFKILNSKVESIYWILYQKLSLASILDGVNVIQQKKLVLMMQRIFKDPKKINRVDILLLKKTSEEKNIFF